MASPKELTAILAKHHDELTEHDKRLLLRLAEIAKTPTVNLGCQPISPRQLLEILDKPMRDLSHDERATLAAFYGVVSVRKRLLEESGIRS